MSDQIDVAKELATIKGVIPKLAFPIQDAQNLSKQLQGKTFTDPFTHQNVQANDGIKHVPSATFPIKSQQDFDSKISGLIARRATKLGIQPINVSDHIDVARELATIKGVIPKLAFPIQDAQSLLKQLQGKTFTDPFTHQNVQANDGIKHVPSATFPIKSQQDFDSKISGLIVRRATKLGIQPIRTSSD